MIITDRPVPTAMKEVIIKEFIHVGIEGVGFTEFPYSQPILVDLQMDVHRLFAINRLIGSQKVIEVVIVITVEACFS